jgi:hypothetical protein
MRLGFRAILSIKITSILFLLAFNIIYEQILSS